MTSERIRVAVVFGGRSGEHPVSCISAAGVLANIDTDAFDVTAIGITPEGSWLPDGPRRDSGRRRPGTAEGQHRIRRGDAGRPHRRGHGLAGRPATAVDPALDVDVVFPVLHGPYGEDGTIQGLLELAGVPYVGAGVLASAAAMDKEFTKKLLAAEDLPVGRLGGPAAGRRDPERGRPEPFGATGFRQTRAGRVLPRGQPGRLLGRPGPGDRLRPADRSEGAGRGRRAGPGDRVRRAGVPGRPDRGVADGRDPRRRRPRLLRLRRQVPRCRSSHLRHPGGAARRRHRPHPGPVPPGLRRAGRAGPGPGGLLRPPRRRRGDQRGQHAARVHPDLDVPADVGCRRHLLQRADHCADPDRAGQGHRLETDPDRARRAAVSRRPGWRARRPRRSAAAPASRR